MRKQGIVVVDPRSSFLARPAKIQQEMHILEYLEDKQVEITER
jgi:hypothetical protein